MTPSWAAELLDLLLPAGCVACGGWIGRAPELVCSTCRTRLRPAPWPRCRRCHHPRGTGRPEAEGCLHCEGWPNELRAARYAYALEPPASDLVHALKYEGWRELAGFMAGRMSRLLRGPAGSAPADRRRIVVPVPTTPGRLRARGYNQADLLAERLARSTGLPCRRPLRRLEGATSQTSLSPLERRENVRGAFRLLSSGARALGGAHVVLVDDVLTTGATASEVAVTLSSAGVSSVTLVAFARALPDPTRAAA